MGALRRIAERNIAEVLTIGVARLTTPPACQIQDTMMTPFFAAGQSSAQDVRDACMKDAAHFRALAERIERRSKTDKREQSEH
jgi:hypothetical protein